ncbi:membrane-spanning 4-domains subfamily A member 3 isoform X2 [Meriones unguiculatus]|uniref:membrane-spanning 4-domains subfamily A member 3 isoform X2 n=1 Tax=Meriones unguiculatus TaxID=10047 RepID=UPI00293E6B21|nr:membrane-spanning 4-domains subfamily A member 3 isoform X2 [Meriones unguiculatus]
MASRLGTSEGGISPGSHMKPEETGGPDYQPLDESHGIQTGVLQALGGIQILDGILILALGVFLGCLQYLSHHFRHFFFFTFYTGYPLWGGLFMQNSFGMSIASATIAFVGTVFLSMHLEFSTQTFQACQSSQSPDLCFYLGSSSNGLVSLMLILTLLQLALAISISAMWCLGNVCGSKEAISSPPNSVESGMPPDGNDSENPNIQVT